MIRPVESQEQISNKQTTQHSQFDIYPEKLIQADQALAEVEGNLSQLALAILHQRQFIQSQLESPTQPQTHHSEPSEFRTPNNSQPSSQTQDSLAELRARFETSSMPDQLLRVQGNRINSSLVKWEECAEKIDTLRRQQISQATAFYQEKLDQIHQIHQILIESYQKRLKMREPPGANPTAHAGQTSKAVTEDPGQNRQKHMIEKGQEHMIEKGQECRIEKGQECMIEKGQGCMTEQQRVAELQEQPAEYHQLVKLLEEKESLGKENLRLQEELASMASTVADREALLESRDVMIRQKDATIEEKDAIIEQLNLKVQEGSRKLDETQQAWLIQETKLQELQSKIQQKDKQILNIIHGQSSFAAQQLMNLEAALLKEKQDSDKDRLEYSTKLNEMAESLRLLNFTCEKQKQELARLAETPNVANPPHLAPQLSFAPAQRGAEKPFSQMQEAIQGQHAQSQSQIHEIQLKSEEGRAQLPAKTAKFNRLMIHSVPELQGCWPSSWPQAYSSDLISSGTSLEQKEVQNLQDEGPYCELVRQIVSIMEDMRASEQDGTHLVNEKLEQHEGELADETFALKPRACASWLLPLLNSLPKLVKVLRRKQMESCQTSNKEKVERLFDVIRSMIINFKISLKSMEKIISMKESGDLSKNKYMHLKLYLGSLYKVLEQENAAKNESSRLINQGSDSVPFAIPLYQNQEDKVQKLSSELSKVRMELDYKKKQLEDLKLVAADQPHPTESKPDCLAATHLETSVQSLLREVEQYKKKCAEYETEFPRSAKKKTEKIIYIRK